MPTIIDLGQKIKAKYPEYKDMSDEEVGKRVKEKYPTAYMDFADTTPQQLQQKPKTGIMEEIAKTPYEIGVGIAKGGLSTISGVSELGQKLLQKTVGKAIGATERPIVRIPEKYTEAGGARQKIGKGAEQIAEFLIPAGQSTKIIGTTDKFIDAYKAGRFMAGASKLAIKMGVGSIELGGVTALQTGGDKEAVKKAATIGAIMPVAGAVIGKIGEGVQEVGKKIGSSVIRATKLDIEDGFNINNVYKYNAGGSLENTLKTTNSQMNALGKKLQEKIGQSDKTINLNELFNKTAVRIKTGKAAQFGTQTKISGALEQLKSEIALQGEKGVVDLPTAQLIKRGAGTMGAWKYNIQDPESKAIEKVYNTFYNVIKTEIENKSPAGVKEINKALSELIPIHNAVVRRLPVAERNNALSLTDSIGLLSSVFDPKALGVTILNKLLKTGQVGNILVKKGVGLTQPSKIAPIIKGAIVKSITGK